MYTLDALPLSRFHSADILQASDSLNREFIVPSSHLQYE